MEIVDEFSSLLRQILAEVFSPALLWHGYPERIIGASETRLRTPLPRVLRALYQIAGRHPAWRTGLQHLVPPGELKLDERALTFMVEQQGVCFYLVRREDLALPDPPVYQGNYEEETLYPDCCRLSSFLVKMLCWQAMELRPSATGLIRHSELARIAAGMERVECGEPDYEYPVTVLRRGSLVACAFPEPEKAFNLYVAAKNRRELRRFETEFGIGLSWN